MLRSLIGSKQKAVLHREEYIYLPHVQTDSAIIAWGAFFFKDLKRRPISRRDTIGLRSLPYTTQGELVCVELYNEQNQLFQKCYTEEENHIQICDLTPDSTYHYRVTFPDRNGESLRYSIGCLPGDLLTEGIVI